MTRLKVPDVTYNAYLPAKYSSGALSRCGMEKLRKAFKDTLVSLAGFNTALIAKIICWFNSAGDSMHRLENKMNRNMNRHKRVGIEVHV